MISNVIHYKNLRFIRIF